MANARLAELTELGQSVWLDYIRRDLFSSGELERMISDLCVRGETSNPTIFDKAIADSDLYDSDVQKNGDDDPEAIFYELAIADIQQACDLFRTVFDESGGHDGFVSIEVSPRLAYDTQQTTAEAERLWNLVDRPNLMVKIPGTEAGLPAIESTIAKGINVNVTLLFSTQRHMQAADSYIRGLHKAKKAGFDLGKINSVASFFVSRVDSLVDKQLGEIGTDDAKSLQGLAAVANARIAYKLALEKFSGAEWDELATAGATIQRPLWASTSTKNPAYKDVKYVEELIGPDTVNTMPEATLRAFADHGKAELALDGDADDAEATMQSLARVGIDLDQVTKQLEQDGVDSFIKSYEDLLESISEKRSQLKG